MTIFAVEIATIKALEPWGIEVLRRLLEEHQEWRLTIASIYATENQHAALGAGAEILTRAVLATEAALETV